MQEAGLGARTLALLVLISAGAMTQTALAQTVVRPISPPLVVVAPPVLAPTSPPLSPGLGGTMVSPPSPSVSPRAVAPDVIEHRLGGCPEGPPCPKAPMPAQPPDAGVDSGDCSDEKPCPKVD